MDAPLSNPQDLSPEASEERLEQIRSQLQSLERRDWWLWSLAVVVMLLFLVAPAIRFHSATDILLRYLGKDIEVCRVGVSENWRRGLRVVLRQG